MEKRETGMPSREMIAPPISAQALTDEEAASATGGTDSAICPRCGEPVNNGGYRRMHICINKKTTVGSTPSPAPGPAPAPMPSPTPNPSGR